MGRKRKAPNISQSENLDFGVQSDVAPEVIPVEVEGHTETQAPKSFKDRATEKLSSILVESDDNISLSDTQPKARKKWVPKAQREETQTEFSTLISSILAIILALSKWPEEVKPDQDELNGVAHHTTRILLRHIDISGKLTGDVLDAIGIIAIGSAWYTRVAPVLRRYKESNEGPVFRSYNEATQDVEEKQTENWVTPIEQANPAMKNWLDQVADGGEDQLE